MIELEVSETDGLVQAKSNSVSVKIPDDNRAKFGNDCQDYSEALLKQDGYITVFITRIAWLGWVSKVLLHEVWG